MATSKTEFSWLRDEIAAIKSRRFHLFTPVPRADLEYRFGDRTARLKGGFRHFLEEFGWALLYTDSGDAPIVSAYPLRAARRFVLADGDTYIGFGYRDQQSVFFRESLILSKGESPVFEGSARGVKMVNETFEDWLRESCAWARKKLGAKAWKKIVDGPKPFSAREQQIVAARAQFKWRHIGFAANGDARFEVTNGSDMKLPFLSIGVQGKGGSKLVGGVWLDVSRIAPGQTKVVQQDCYKDQLEPKELEVFALEEPIPEKKERYWEFEPLKAGR